MADPSPLLGLTAHLPEVHLVPGEALVTEGGRGGALWVLVRGALEVRLGGVLVNRITQPGALVGEVAVLLEGPSSASVLASEPSVVRHAEDGRALLSSDPQVTMLVATGLAERLRFVTTYLADLTRQYQGVPGLAMVDDVLRELATTPVPPARPGSARDPDPEY